MAVCMEVRILGGGREVGRTAILLKEREGSILLDYGVSFDERDVPQLPLHVRPVDVNALVISHAHLDHVGAAPYLFITGNPKTITTKPTLDVARLLTIDFLRLNAHYIDYELREFDRMYSSAEFLNYGEKAEVDAFEIQSFNAGHIMGSSLTYVETPSGEHVLYTGDFNAVQTWTLSSVDTPPLKPTTIIVESTYGARNHPPRHLVEKRLLEVVEDTVDRGGVVLIPAFSVGRTQEVMTILYAQAPYLDIYVDGLSRDVTELYVKYRKFLRDPGLFLKVVENVNFITDFAMRKKILKKPCVVIASAGMLKGGPSLYYLKQIQGNSRNAIVLVSYQAVNSNGHKILESGVLREQGIEEPIKARLTWLDLSSHSGSDDIVKFVLHYKSSVRNVIIVHGNPEDADELSRKLKEQLGEDVNVLAPPSGGTVQL
ncbi:MAG: MBL fold metallo-hydrolase [Desulfurococcaceae archaeon]